jgi:methylmalonyl-CoA mutase
MKNWDFNPVELSDWRAKIKNELGQDNTDLRYSNEFEEITIDIALKKYSRKYSTSAFRDDSSPTKNATYIEIYDEREANKLALHCLNYGADALFFEAKKEKLNWSLVIAGIELNYIKSWFLPLSKTQYDDLKALINIHDYNECEVLMNHANLTNNTFHGFSIHQIGAPAFLEISYILYSINNYLASSKKSEIENKICIITCGLEGNYFIDMAKIRAMKFLVNQLFNAYGVQPIKLEYHAHTGWTNKGLKDRDTNLLRQTTEVMAAYASNVSAIFNNPSTLISKQRASKTDWRLALNIVNLLKEESYFDRVINPLDGAQVFEQLVDQIIDKSWETFTTNQEKIEEEFHNFLISKIQTCRSKKITAFRNKQLSKIGINVFLKNEKQEQELWGEIPHFLGLPYLILEKEL